MPATVPIVIGTCEPCDPEHFPPVIGVSGSPNVFINSQAAMRLGDDFVVDCLIHDPPHTTTSIALEGSSTVYVNGLPKCRIDDKTSCDKTIITGSSNVFAGGSPTDTPVPWEG